MAVTYNTRLFIYVTVVLLTIQLCGAENRAPFEPGYSMGNGGTILWHSGIGGRQPWVPACFYADTLRMGISIAGIDYYDAMDNLSSLRIRHACLGFWYASPSIITKCSYLHFDAFKMYFEQSGFISVGTTALPYIALSMELRANRFGLRRSATQRNATAELGFSLWIPRTYAALQMRIDHLTLYKPTTPGFEHPPVLTVGFHTQKHELGALGLTMQTHFEKRTQFRMFAGQEFWLFEVLGIALSIGTNPIQFSFGLSYNAKHYSSSISLVHDPTLGWSQGFSADYVN